MPTLIPSSQVNAFLALVAVAPYPGGPAEVDRITTSNLLVYYSDIITCIMRQQELFASNNSYLTQAMACFDDNEMQAVGIWNNKQQSSPPLTNPVLIVNSTFTTVDLTATSPAIYVALSLMGNTYIGTLNLSLGVILNELYIGPGCTIDVYSGASYVSSPPVFTKTNTIWMPNIKNKPATLNAVTYESQIGNIILEPGSYYGGVMDNDPNLPCGQNVSNITATEQTKNAVLISWVNPVLNSPVVSPANNYLFLNLFYRLTDSNPWIKVTEADGDWVNDTGFIFRSLQSDTFYDIQIQTVCQNGGVAKETITIQTLCCGAGTQLPTYIDMPIQADIVASVDPTQMQTLWNGDIIALQYPAGPTLTIPYLVGVKNVYPDVVVDNIVYQNFPFNKSTGTFNAAATSLNVFVATSVVSIKVSVQQA